MTYTALPLAIDIFIVGGGPAGLACAIASAQCGLQVLVADGIMPPIDKACGEGLMPDTVAALRKLGVHLDHSEESAAPIRGIRFIDTANEAAAHAAFPDAGEGRGVKRRTLHRLLLGRAVELGVTFAWGTVVQSFTVQGSSLATIETSRGQFKARFIVGADGLQSQVRSFAGLDRATTSAKRIGLRQHFAVAPWTDFVEVYWSGHGQAYVTPTSATEVCVAFVNKTKYAAGVPDALTHFPELSAHLAKAEPSDAPRGAITYSRKLHRVTRGNVALVGDASGSVDAVTGEGLSLAFRQALALADAMHVGDLAAYQHSHRRMGRMPHLMANTMLLLDRSPMLRSRSISLLAHLPRIFAWLLKVHIGHGHNRKAAATVLPAAITSHPISTPMPHNAVP